MAVMSVLSTGTYQVSLDYNQNNGQGRAVLIRNDGPGNLNVRVILTNGQVIEKVYPPGPEVSEDIRGRGVKVTVQADGEILTEGIASYSAW